MNKSYRKFTLILLLLACLTGAGFAIKKQRHKARCRLNYDVSQPLSSHFVWNRVLASQCENKKDFLFSDAKDLNPSSLTIPTQDHERIFICTAQLKDFCEKILPTIQNTFVLVTGCADPSPTDLYSKQELNSILNDPRLEAWYCGNLDFDHEKAHFIPIGIDYHSPGLPPKKLDNKLKELSDHSTKPSKRKLRCFANFAPPKYPTPSRNRYRLEALKALKNHPSVDLITKRIPLFDSWEKQQEYSFVISPTGHGWDCHRTWEALALKCIPIVNRSPISRHLEKLNLPIVFVDDWNEVNEDNLEKWKKEMLPKLKEAEEKITSKYWLSRILTETPSAT